LNGNFGRWNGRSEKSKDPDVKPTSGAPGEEKITQRDRVRREKTGRVESALTEEENEC